MHRFAIRALALTLVAAALLTGCRQNVGVVSIKTLLDDPSQFDKHTVRIVGDVTKSIGVLGYGAYEVTDDSGAIMVVTKENGAPRKGAHVGVEGEFRSAFTLGSETVAVIMEHGRITPPPAGGK